MREYENNSPHAYLTTLSLKQAIMDIIFEFQKEYPFLINFRVLYHSHFYKDGKTYQDASGKNGFDLQRTGKHPSRICLDMIIGP